MVLASNLFKLSCCIMIKLGNLSKPEHFWISKTVEVWGNWLFLEYVKVLACKNIFMDSLYRQLLYSIKELLKAVRKFWKTVISFLSFSLTGFSILSFQLKDILGQYYWTGAQNQGGPGKFSGPGAQNKGGPGPPRPPLLRPPWSWWACFHGSAKTYA